MPKYIKYVFRIFGTSFCIYTIYTILNIFLQLLPKNDFFIYFGLRNTTFIKRIFLMFLPVSSDLSKFRKKQNHQMMQ